MNVVKISLYAEGYYSDYNEEIIISEELYRKIEDELDEYDYEKYGDDFKEIYVTGLDGEHSEVEGEICVIEYQESELDDFDWEDLESSDGKTLYYKLKSFCEAKGENLDNDIKTVTQFLKAPDTKVTFSITVKKSDVDKIKEFVCNLD